VQITIFAPQAGCTMRASEGKDLLRHCGDKYREFAEGM